MITIKKYSSENQLIWDDFVEKSKNGTFMLKRGYMDYHSDRFKDFSLMFYEEDDLVALLPCSIHDKELRSHGGLTYGGFITNSKMKQHRMIECVEELKKFLKEQNISKLIYKAIPHIYHTLPSEEDLYALWKNGAKLFRRDISTTIELNNPIKMPKGRKAQISRAKREGVVIEESNDFETFIKLENEVLKSQHNTSAVHTGKELELLKSRFENEIHLWVAKYNSEIIAGTLIFEYKNLVHTQYMASNDLSRQIGGLDLLIFELIEKYKGNKRYFDFGISTEDGGKYLNTGLISQKEGFGGRGIVYDFYELEIG